MWLALVVVRLCGTLVTWGIEQANEGAGCYRVFLLSSIFLSTTYETTFFFGKFVGNFECLCRDSQLIGGFVLVAEQIAPSIHSFSPASFRELLLL